MKRIIRVFQGVALSSVRARSRAQGMAGAAGAGGARPPVAIAVGDRHASARASPAARHLQRVACSASHASLHAFHAWDP